MSLVIEGKTYSLKNIMRDRMYEQFSKPQLLDLSHQLHDASKNTTLPRRKEQYAEWARNIFQFFPLPCPVTILTLDEAHAIPQSDGPQFREI